MKRAKVWGGVSFAYTISSFYETVNLEETLKPEQVGTKLLNVHRSPNFRISRRRLPHRPQAWRQEGRAGVGG